jgi:NosL
VSRRSRKFVDETLVAPAEPSRSYLAEPELYIEPTPMTSRDTLGVIAALLALAVIGVSGYVWLNPQLTARSLLVFRKEPATNVAVVADTAPAIEHIDCPYCGMYADQSDCAVAVMWQGGGSATFDSFDCVFNYIKENDVKLAEGTVLSYADRELADSWVGLELATYLYGTTAIAGSMEPYVAAFGSKEQALEAQQTLGGEVVDFAGLQAKWN